jgi:DNA modification methylase
VEDCRLIEGDCLEAMRLMESGSIDAVITDPPYCAGAITESGRARANGQGLRSVSLDRFGWFTGDNMGTAGLAFLLRAVAFESVRIVKPTGSLLVFCDWRMVASLAPAIESAGLRFQNLIVWNKGSMGLGTGFRAQHELIMHFTFGQAEYHDKAFGNVLVAPRVTADDREHQTQKPVGLLRQIIRVVCPPGGVVLDPFAGSGTSGIAALAEGRRAVLIEREPQYVEITRKRLAAFDGPLFPGGRAEAATLFAKE